jgi:hypothetical protein
MAGKQYAYGTPTKAIPSPQAKPPSGWRRATGEEITPEIVTASARAAKTCAPVGKQSTYATKDGKLIMFLTEWHWDNHVSKDFMWHPGISVFVPVKPVTVPKQPKAPVYDPLNPTGGSTDIVEVLAKAGKTGQVVV